MDRFNVVDLKAFAAAEFGGADLGDARLDRRLLTLVEGLAADPSRSIPKALGQWSAIKGAYRLLAHVDVTRERVLMPHFQATSERIRQVEDVLVVQDTTFLNFTHHPATEGLGNIGSKGAPNQLRGVLVHSSLVVTPDSHRVLGLLDQQVIVRREYKPAGRSSKTIRKQDRESQKWLVGIQNAVQRTADSKRLIFVFDREGDVFECFERTTDLGARFVIRASNNRRLECVGGDGDRAYLFDSIRTAGVVSRMTVDLPAGNGRRARRVDLTLRAATYALLPPSDRKRSGSSRQVNVLAITEDAPPVGQKPLEWTLLTSEPVDSPAAAAKVARAYCGRWKIEEWHKGLKTGCHIEDRQIENWDRLDVLLGIYSVIGWRLLVMRDAARAQEPCPTDVLSDADRAILHRVDPKLPKTASSRDYLRAIAKLGGFIGRKGDGDPGWITLWHGYTRLCDMRLGFDAAAGA